MEKIKYIEFVSFAGIGIYPETERVYGEDISDIQVVKKYDETWFRIKKLSTIQEYVYINTRHVLKMETGAE